jgi:response regulator RpfG family c-di-GMP phosphodiesterase
MLFTQSKAKTTAPLTPQGTSELTQGNWKLLIVDDEPDVHAVTKLALARFKLDDRALTFLSAFSAAQAKEILKHETDIAVAFIDVVMESDHAGLALVKWIREELGNKTIRLILRTGQPGQAPEEYVIMNYDINDYKAKAELDSRKLMTSVYSSLRSYRDIIEIEHARAQQVLHRQGLERVLDATSGLFKLRTLHKFANGLLNQIAGLLKLRSETLILSYNGIDAISGHLQPAKIEVLAGTGNFKQCRAEDVPLTVLALLNKSIESKRCLYEGNCFVGYFPTKDRHWVNLLYMEGLDHIDELDKQLIDIFSVNVAVAFENLLLSQEVEDTQSELILRLGDVVESRSKEAANHVVRMAEYCYELALLIGLGEPKAALLKRAAPMHDIGKIAIPDAVLLKPDKLNGDEWKIMRQHPRIGHQILASSERPILKAAAIISLQHHEKYDGTGYPEGLQGVNIHIFARIVAIADVFDALTHKRCYKEAWPLEDVLEEMLRGKGKHFDPDILSVFIEHVDKFVAIKNSYQDSFTLP